MNTWNHNSSGKSRIFRALSAGALFLSAGTAASAQVLIDDFNDGDDSGWLPMANPEDLIGSWDASTGAYRLQAPGPLQPSEGLAALWGGPGVLENGHLRATVVRETENSRTSLFMRVSGETGYWFGWAPPPYGFVIARFDTFDTGVLLAAAETGFAQEVGVEYVMEAGAIGSTLELRMWAVGEPRPEFAQVTASDSAYATGASGVFARSGAIGNVSSVFDDVMFTSSCPTDIDGDNLTGVVDLVHVILAWGTADPGADVNADGAVDVQDLVQVITNWGPCP